MFKGNGVLLVSLNIFVQRVTETSNVFFSNPYFLNWRDISRFSWPINLKFGGDLHRMCLYRTNHGFQNLMFLSIFFFFFTIQTTKITRKIDILNSKCWNFFNFRKFAVFVIHTIAIFVLIKMHFGFLVSNNQMDHVSHSNPF